mgnify:CR=1 FL=1
MKRIILLAASAMAILAGCTRTEIRSIADEPQQITFRTVVGQQSTKALISGIEYPTAETFGSFAFFNKQGETFPTGASLYMPNSEVTLAAPAASGKAWTTDIPYYWPKQGSLTFFSYSPFNKLHAQTTCDATDGIKITGWDVNANQDVDVMVADVKKNLTKATGNGTNGGYTDVVTVFRHKLSQIVGFKFQTANDYAGGRAETSAKVGDKYFYFTKIAVNNVKYMGTYKSTIDVDGANLGSWTPRTDTKDYVWYESTTGTSFNATATAAPAPTSGYILVLPQDFTDPGAGSGSNVENIEIKYTIRTYVKAYSGNADDYTEEEVHVYAPLYSIHDATTAGDTKWHMNKTITYSFTVDLDDDQIYWAPSVEDWENGTVTDIQF